MLAFFELVFQFLKWFLGAMCIMFGIFCLVAIVSMVLEYLENKRKSTNKE